jgi:hypothetical protein
MKYPQEYEFRNPSRLFWDLIFQVISFGFVVLFYIILIRNPEGEPFAFVSPEAGFFMWMFPLMWFWIISHIDNLREWREVLQYREMSSGGKNVSVIEKKSGSKLSLIFFVGVFAAILFGFAVKDQITGNIFVLVVLALISMIFGNLVVRYIQSVMILLRIIKSRTSFPFIFFARIIFIPIAITFFVVLPFFDINLYAGIQSFAMFPIFVGIYTLITLIDFITFRKRNPHVFA